MDFINDNWFVIKDLDGFVNSSRALVFNNYGKKNDLDPLSLKIDSSEQDELDSVLSFDETMIIVKGIAKKQRSKSSKNIRYIINDNLYYDIVQALSDRLTSNILNSLVNKGLVETAYDEEADDFIFWIKDNENQQPETD